jgi:hypothetical protein
VGFCYRAQVGSAFPPGHARNLVIPDAVFQTGTLVPLHTDFDGLRERVSSLLRTKTPRFERPSDGRLWSERAIDLPPVESPLRAHVGVPDAWKPFSKAVM